MIAFHARNTHNTVLLRRVFSILLAVFLIFYGQLSIAQTADSGAGRRGAARSATLDLSSTERSITARVPRKLDAVDILVGGSTRSIVRGALLTPAEFVALTQVLRGRQQSLQLDTAGSAVGGQFFLTNRIEKNFSDMVIPSGVTALLNAARSREFDLSGSLLNNGSIFAFSSNARFDAAAISAATITNQQGALISSMLPAGGLPGVSSAVESLHLFLNATGGDFTNLGTISSSGNLNVTAAGSIINALPAGVAGATPVMQAANNLNLVSGTGNIVNTNGALLSAATGNISIATLVPHDILINSLGGQVAALLGSINVRDSNYSGAGDIDISGGDWLSKDLNLYSGTGDVRAQLNDVTGNLSTHAGFANVSAATENLSLGEICVSGDPTFFNPVGNISINGNITVAERLAILAAGNITSAVPGLTITARDGTGQGFDITMVAGASLSPLLGGGQTSAIPGTQATGNVTVNGPAILLTGNIDLSAADGLQIQSNSTTGNLNGGNVTLLAFLGGVLSTGGRVLLPANSTINTSGSGAGNNGNVIITAGGDGSPTPVISVGNIIANGGTGSGGDITIRTAQPTVGGGVTFNTAGAITAGTFGAGATTAGADANIAIANLSSLSAGNNLSLTAGTAGTSRIVTNGGSVALSAGNDINIAAGGGVSTSPGVALGGGDLTMTAGTVTATGSINAPVAIVTSGTSSGAGGDLSATAGSTGSITFGTITANGAATGDGGSVTLTSGTGGTLTTGNIQANGGPFGDGGSVTVAVDTAVPYAVGAGGSIPSISANAGGSAGDGGSIIVRNSGAGGLTLNSFASLTVNAPAGSGGTLELDAGFGPTDGPLTFPAAGGTLAATGGNGAGGNIVLRGSTTNIGGLASALTLDASGTTTGGTVEVTTTDSSAAADLTIGTAAGQLNPITSPSGGAITVSSGHDLAVVSSVSTGDLSLAAGNLMTFAPGITASGSASVALSAPTISLGALSLITTSDPGSTVTVTSPTGFDLTIEAPSGDSATIEAPFTSYTVCCTDQFPPLGLPSSGSVNIAPASGQALIFSNSGSDPTTLNLNGSVIATTEEASTTVGDDVTVASTGPIFLFVDNGVLFNNGVITSTSPAANGFAEDIRPGFPVTSNQITVGIVSRAGSLTLGGNSGEITATGGAEIWVASYGSDTNINSSCTFTVGTTGAVLIEAKNAYQNNVLTIPAGAISVGDSVTVTVNGANAAFPGFLLQAPTINLGDNSELFSSKATGNTGLLINSSADPGVPGPLTINLFGTAALNTGGSFVAVTTSDNFALALGQTLTLQSGIAGTSTLESNAPLLFIVQNGTFVDNNVAVTDSSSGFPGIAAPLTFIGGNNNAGIANTLTMTGTNPGPITATSLTNPIGIVLVTVGNESTININASYTFSAQDGQVFLQTRLPNVSDQPGSINLASGITLTSDRPLMFNTTELNLGANSSVVSTVASGPAISVLSSVNGPKPLTINLPGGSSATMSTLGGSIIFMPSSGNGLQATVAPETDQPIVFSTTGGNTTLFLTGGPVSTTTANTSTTDGSTTIDAGVTLASDSGITINVNDATLVNNGTVSYTGLNAIPSVATITVQSTSNMTLAGTGTFANNASSTTAFLAMAAGSTLTVADAAALTVSGGGAISIRTPNLTFDATTTSPSLTATGASAISVDSGDSAADVNLVITAPAGFAGTLATTGGAISIAPTGTGTLTFANSGLASTTLNLDGGPVAMDADSVTVNADTTVSSDDAITINVADSATGALSLQSNAAVLATGGDLDIQAAGALLVNLASGSELRAGTASSGEGFDLTFNSAVSGAITVDAGAFPTFNGTLSAEGDDIVFNGGLGAVDVEAAAIIGTVLANGSSVSIQTNSGLTTGAITSAGSISASASGGDLTITDTVSGDAVTLETIGNFDVLLGANVTGTTSVTVTAGGSGSISQTSGLISGPTVTLSSSTGNIGSSLANIMTDADNIVANTGGSGDVFIMETDDVSIGASSSGDEFVLSAGGDIATTGAISAPVVTLQTKPGTNGSIDLGDDVGQAGGITTLIADGTGDITQTAGSVLGNTAVLTSGTGNIGTGINPIETAVADLTVNTSGAGSVFINQTGVLTLEDSTAGTGFVLTASDATSVGSISTLTGVLTVSNATGLLEVRQDAGLSTGSGDITLQNDNTATGAIVLRPNVVVVAGGNPGNVFIVIGGVNPVPGTQPVNVSASTANGGQIFYGANSIQADPPTNFVFANGGQVIFNTNTLGAGAITLQGNVRIGAVGGPLLNSLDLTNPAVVAVIVQLQQDKVLGGKLKVDGSGVAIGGKLSLTPFNLMFNPPLTAVVIPVKVKLTLQNFDEVQPFDVHLTNNTVPSVVINGKTTFTGKLTNPVINIATDFADPAFILGSAGSIKTKTASLTLNADGDVVINGKMPVKNLTITTTPGSDGDILVGNSIGSKKTPTLLTADGSILQSGGKSIVGSTVTLVADQGSIGLLSNSLSTTTANLQATAGLDVFVTNKGNLNLLSSSSGEDFHLGTSGSLTVGDVQASDGSIDLIAGGKTLTVQPGSDIVASGDANIMLQNTKSSGSIFIGNGATISALAFSPPDGNVQIFIGAAPPPMVNQTPQAGVTENISLGGAIFYGTNGILANGTNTVTAKGAIVTFSTGTRPASAITLDGGVGITADPPMLTGVSLAMSGGLGQTREPSQGSGLQETPLNIFAPAINGSAGSVGETAVPAQAYPVPAGADSSRTGLIPITYRVGAGTAGQTPWFFDDSFTAASPMTGACVQKLAIDAGEVLLAPKQNLSVSTAAGQLHVAAGSIVLTISTPDATIVYNLHDRRQGAVKLIVDHREIHVAPGRMLLVASSEKGLTQNHPARSIGYRKMKDLPSQDSLSIYTGEFSISSALQTVGALQKLQVSKSIQHARILSQILKTAAVLSTVGGSAEPYRPLELLPLVSSRSF